MTTPSEYVPPPANRSIVTEEALHVSRQVLGLPLASPWRRAGAMLIDAVLVAILANAPSVLFGFAAAYVLFRVSARRKPGGGYIRRGFRFMFRLGGAMVLFAVAISLWGSARDWLRDDDDEGARASVTVDGTGPDGPKYLSGQAAVRFAAGVIALRGADSEPEARAAAERVLQGMRRSGVSGSEARAALRELSGEVEGKPWMPVVVQSVIALDSAAEAESARAVAGDTAAVMDADSLVVAYAAALSAGDSAAVDSLRSPVVARLSADTVAVLAGTIASLDHDRDQLQSQVRELREEVEEGPGMMGILRALTEDLGLGLGWFGLYFTATTALWQGRTPGKRLFRIRVISLTGKPIGWWVAFERFGGYAAGFATGLLGFLQVFWDDNRQAIHDKIAATAVIRD